MEQRRTPRVPVSIKVGADGSALGAGYAQNLSTVGMAIDAQALTEHSVLPRVGERLRLRFKLPKSPLVISATGRIVRIDKGELSPRFALEFETLDPDFQNEIERFVAASHR